MENKRETLERTREKHWRVVIDFKAPPFLSGQCNSDSCSNLLHVRADIMRLRLAQCLHLTAPLIFNISLGSAIITHNLRVIREIYV